MNRTKLPARRRTWTQKAKLDGQTFYLSCSEYSDGRPGEIWLEAHKEGTFSRGILSALARMTSIALQCGASITDVLQAFEGFNFPPNGPVEGSDTVTQALSVPDWIAKELRAKYVKQDTGSI